MRKSKYILLFGLLLTQTANAQCDKTNRDKIVFTSLTYFQDSINSPKASILLLDSTQFSKYPNLSIDPDLKRTLPDTTILADLLTGFNKTFKLKVHQTGLTSCPRIALRSLNTVLQTLTDNNKWTLFYKVYPRTSGYYLTSEPFIKNNFAIIYLENYCGSLCGSGYILYLMYRHDLKEWKVIYSKQTWVS